MGGCPTVVLVVEYLKITIFYSFVVHVSQNAITTMPIQAVKFGKLQQVESQVTSPHLRLHVSISGQKVTVNVITNV